MENGRIGLVAAIVLAWAMAIQGCSSSKLESESSGGAGGSGGKANGASGGAVGTGGASGKGGATSGQSGGAGVTGAGGAGGKTSAPASGGNGGGQPTNCTNVAPCGGSVVGTWDVTSSCLTLAGDMDVSLAGLGCSTVPVTGSLKVTGSWTANADGTYADNTTTTGSITFPLSSSCLSISSVPVACNDAASIITALGWSTSTCSLDAGGQCNCMATANQNGGIGAITPSYASNTGDYKTSGSGLNTDSYVDYSYCVSGGSNTLTLTPKPTYQPVTGTIVLQRKGTAPGAGGTSGGGGGSTGAGGAGGGSGTGGKTGAGGGSAGAGGKGGAGGTGTGTGGSAGTGGTTVSGSRPCDIYAAGNVTCVTAHSTVRVLVSSYTGSLYQVKRADGSTKDIGVAAGGFADSAAQDTFCAGSTCTITRIYDQSGHGNFLGAETPDSQDMSPPGHSGMTAASATKDPLTVSGHKVYSLYTNTSQAYWHDGSKSGMPTGSQPQGIYMVTSGTHVNSGCCYDYGNGETSRTYVAGPSMDSLYFGTSTTWGHGTGSGPWIMADMEDGMVIGNSNTPSITYKFVTAIEKNNGTTEWALRGGDATTGALTTLYKGALPAGKNPMKKQGAIVLGSGGDCCYSNNNGSAGTFYEGAIVAGYPSDATEDAIQVNIVSAGYGK